MIGRCDCCQKIRSKIYKGFSTTTNGKVKKFGLKRIVICKDCLNFIRENNFVKILF